MARVWLGIIALGSVVVLGCAALQAQNPAIEEAFRRGAVAMHNGRIADAEQAFRDAVRLAPRMAEAHLDLGLVLARENRLEEATASVEQAIRINPTLESANMFLGIFYHQANREPEARKVLQAEIEQHPNSAEALTWLGMVELAANRPEAAVGAFDRAAALQPDDLNILEYRGRAHNLVARDSYARMARLSPESWHVHRVRAQLAAEAGDHTEAISEYEAALKLEDRNSEIYEELGDEYRKTSQLDAAEKAYARELELSPKNAVALYNLGSTQIERGDNAAGVPLLREMLKSYASSPVAEYYLGRGLAAQGQDAEALPWLENSARSDGSGEVAKRSYYELARIYRKLHRTAEGETALKEYNRIREREQAKDAKQVEDWRKFTAGPASDVSPVPTANSGKVRTE